MAKAAIALVLVAFVVLAADARDQLNKIGLPGKSILGDYFQENVISQRPFLLLRISFPGRPIFIQLPPALFPGCLYSMSFLRPSVFPLGPSSLNSLLSGPSGGSKGFWAFAVSGGRGYLQLWCLSDIVTITL